MEALDLDRIRQQKRSLPLIPSRSNPKKRHLKTQKKAKIDQAPAEIPSAVTARYPQNLRFKGPKKPETNRKRNNRSDIKNLTS